MRSSKKDENLENQTFVQNYYFSVAFLMIHLTVFDIDYFCLVNHREKICVEQRNKLECTKVLSLEEIELSGSNTGFVKMRADGVNTIRLGAQ